MSTPYQEHPDSNVSQALTRLCDALCSWERATGRTSVLVLRESGGFHFRADSGKPLSSDNDDIPDEQLFRMLSQE
ncbi:MAG: hypothetical protein HYR90_01205 [Candidatus Andersenbacteria bacterium]|nr:hypothetical protein [Candidatus Andersenbacteria bacterium]MBI3250487.1 hypothetical protein [Candidatus Andersenbacteria bacterium]